MPFYHIRVSGLLDPGWSEWLEGMTVIHLDDGDTLLAGILPDQSALYGLLNRLRDMNVKLMLVEVQAAPYETGREAKSE